MDPDLLATHLQRADRLTAEPPAHVADDRTLPAAREWLRRWAPKRMTLPPPACSCAAGRCATCN